MQGKGSPRALLLGMEISTQPLWEIGWRFPPKLRTEFSYNPAILLLSIYLKNIITLTEKDICTPRFIAALFTIDKIWKQPKCP